MNSRDYQILHLDTHKSTGTALRFNVMVESSIPPPTQKKTSVKRALDLPLSINAPSGDLIAIP